MDGHAKAESMSLTGAAMGAIGGAAVLERRTRPIPGDSVRVTHLRDMHGYEGGPVDYHAGESVWGDVRCVDPDGFFELVCANGERRGYFLHDPTLHIALI